MASLYLFYSYHRVVLLFQRSRVDDTAKQTAVPKRMLLSLMSLIQKLVMEQQQLTAQHPLLIRCYRHRTCKKYIAVKTKLMDFAVN